MGALPTGTVTFLLTDVEGSTRRWEDSPEAMGLAMARHDELIASCLLAHHGQIVESGREGDSVLAAFDRAGDAATCAIEIQRTLRREPWPAGASLRVRIALNSGEAELRGGHYYGQAVYRCARLMAIAHGGQVLVSQATCELVRDGLPTGANLVDLGFHHLKDLERAEHVFQLGHLELDGEFPPVRSLDPQRHNLPAPTSSFVDRPSELSEITRLVGAHRLLCLTGAAGTGKTRLALQAAARLVDSFPDGVWLVELAPLSDPGLLVPTVMHSLGIKEEPGRPGEETLVADLRAKRLLLVLDNCEHLVAAAAGLTAFVLAQCSEVRALATSRKPLGVAGEVTWLVPAMEVATQAATLFGERALAVRPGFEPAEHRAAVAEICRRLDGIPLAIELAAARASVLSPEEILSRLEDRFRFLTSAPRTAAARHRTLRAALDWSYDLLEADEGKLFRRLSIFASGFSLETAEAVCAFDGIDAVRVLDLLGHLVDQSLVFAQDVGGGRTRYGMLETLRAYGRERLDHADETAAVRRRHAEYFLELAETAEPLLGGQGGHGWLERLDLDHDNLRLVLENSDPPVGLRLASALRGFWDARGHYVEGRARLTAALARSAEPTADRARALRSAGFMAWTQGDHEAATAWCEESLALYRQLGMQAEAGMCLQQLGQIAFQQEDFARARNVLSQALEVATELQDERLAELCQFRIGVIALFELDHAESRRLLDSCLESSRRDGHEEMVVMTLLVLAHLELREGRLDRARAHLTESLSAWGERGAPRQIASLLDGFAALAAAEDQAERALRLAAAAENLREQVAVAAGSALQRDLVERLRPARATLGGPGAAADLGPPLGRDEAIAYALHQGGQR